MGRVGTLSAGREGGSGGGGVRLLKRFWKPEREMAVDNACLCLPNIRQTTLQKYLGTRTTVYQYQYNICFLQALTRSGTLRAEAEWATTFRSLYQPLTLEGAGCIFVPLSPRPPFITSCYESTWAMYVLIVHARRFPCMITLLWFPEYFTDVLIVVSTSSHCNTIHYRRTRITVIYIDINIILAHC